MKPGGSRARFTLATLCVLIAACAMENAADGEVSFAQLRAEPDPVRVGQDLTLTLTNRSDDLIGYNLCVSTLERRDGDAWVTAPEQPTEVCTMELRTLQPDASDSFVHPIPPTLPAGEYRMRTNVEWPLGDAQQTVATRSFRIES